MHIFDIFCLIIVFMDVKLIISILRVGLLVVFGSMVI